jgi:hypothetical protein
MQLVHQKRLDSGRGLLLHSSWVGQRNPHAPVARQGQARRHERPAPFICPGSELGIHPSHPLGQLILPSEVDPRVLPWQE